jgi:TonB family protein
MNHARIVATIGLFAALISPCLAADKVRLMRVDCSLIQGTERVWLVAEPKLSARTVTWVHCGEDVEIHSNQDGWTKVLKESDGRSPKWIEGYIGSSLLVKIPLPDVPPVANRNQPTVGRQWDDLNRFTVGEGDGVAYRVGGAVTAPRAFYTPDPEYSEAARHAKYQGTVGLELIVGADGYTHDIRSTRPLGMGLDQKAIEAVSHWLFEPARKDGKPVAVQIWIDVTFRLY